MEMERIAGALFSGFMCKLYAASLGIWMAYAAGCYINHAFTAVRIGLGG